LPRASSGDRLDPKTERRTVVSQGNWLDPEAAGGQEGLTVVVPHQPQPIEFLKPLVDLQRLAVRLMTVENDPAPHHDLKRGRSDVVAVGVRQHDRVDARPVRLHAREPLVKGSRSQADVDQQPGSSVMTDQGGIAP